MTFKHGLRCELWMNATDISPYFASADPDAKVDTVDVTTFKSTWHNFLVGQAKASMSATGYYDPTNVGTTLFTTLQAAPGVLTVFPAGALAIGDIGWLLSYNSAHLKEGSKIAGAVSLDWGVESTSTVGQGVCLHILQAENVGTINGTGDGVLTSASSATGAIATLHVTAMTGGDSHSFRLQDSTTLGGAYTDIASGAFAAVTAVGAQRLVVPGTVRAFVRCVAVIAGHAATYGVAVART